MLTFFRSFFKSKFGVVFTLGFLALIAFAFASSDVANTGTFGGVAGGDRVAVVGDERIGNAELSRAASAQLDAMREQNPTLTMPAFVEQGGLERVLDGMIDRFAIGSYAKLHGLRAGENLVNSEIIQIPAFRGAGGNFDENAYRSAIAQRGLTDQMVRSDLANGLLAQQLLTPVSIGARIPDQFVSRYASLLKERREGTIAIVLSAAYAPSGDPTDKQLQAYYDKNKANYIRPERRTLRYITFGDEQITDRIEPTEAEIAAQYEKDKAKYAASEERTYTQLIVPTQQAANSIRERVQAGGSLEAAAQEAGLQTAKLGPATRDSLLAESSKPVADAVFAAKQGTIAAPARSGLGWHVVRIDSVKNIPGRSLSDASPEIAAELRATNRRKALNDLAATIEEQIDDGTSLADVAKELGVKIATSEPLTADGSIYGTSQPAAAVLRPVIATVFQVEDEGEPMLAEAIRGETFIAFEVGSITRSATAPFKEIKSQLTGEWRMAEGARLAKLAVDKVLARVAKGEALPAAMRAENIKSPQFEAINLTREQLTAQGQVPPPLALMFSMAEGTAKKLEAPNNAGWFVIDLDRIEAGKIAKDDPLFAQAKQQLGGAMGQEYAEQSQNAVRAATKIERNDAGIDAVRKQLIGES
ncbi:MAG: SurA N-terminal domain-containing protein [Sphingomonadaceae bacterium]|nr:SurA N-terminal domain-containing protein [Sphingomonadaceae bacterium]